MGRGELPREFRLAGVTWRHARTVKHDFFAATGFYEDAARPGRRAVLKVSRVVDCCGLPMEWLGRWLCRREVRFYNRLSDLPNVPRVLGIVGRTGFVHEYVEGRPLSRNRPVPDGFFAQLFALLHELHRRGVAYVDTNKPENILLGADGRPHLIDFQISWDLHRFTRWRLNRWLLRRLQAEDLYHVRKHHRRLRPDELSAGEATRARQKSTLIRVHRLIAAPYKQLRRQTMARLRHAGRLLPEGSK
jgi:RIO-like serine/threonine protein kinase